MKTRLHPLNKTMNVFDNKENINPLLNYNPNKPELKKNTKENFFDEMDQLLNADFWQKNNRTNLIPSKKDNKANNNISMTNNNINKIVYNNPFGLNVNNNQEKNDDFSNLINMMKSNINKENLNKSMNLFNVNRNGINTNNTFNLDINQSFQGNKLSNISFNKNNPNIFHPNKKVEIDNNNNNNKENKDDLNLNTLANLGTETKNRFNYNSNTSSTNNNILQMIPPNKAENTPENKLDNLEVINSYDMEEVFGSELNSSGIGPNPQIKNSQNDKNYFNQPIHTLMRTFPLSSIINFPSLNRVQEECFDLLFRTDERALITSPTGSGKTLLFELGIARIIIQN